MQDSNLRFFIENKVSLSVYFVIKENSETPISRAISGDKAIVILAYTLSPIARRIDQNYRVKYL